MGVSSSRIRARSCSATNSTRQRGLSLRCGSRSSSSAQRSRRSRLDRVGVFRRVSPAWAPRPPTVLLRTAYRQPTALLGVSGTVVVCHGSADGPDIASGIALAARLHREGVIPAVAGLADDLLTELSSAGGLTIRDAIGERS